jgi:hypothetical protein
MQNPLDQCMGGLHVICMSLLQVIRGDLQGHVIWIRMPKQVWALGTVPPDWLAEGVGIQAKSILRGTLACARAAITSNSSSRTTTLQP